MDAGFWLSLIFIVFVLCVVVYLVITNLIYICSPSEVLVFSGGRHPGPAGRTVGYRVVKGGRATRVPFLETVERVDLRNMNIDVSVKGAFCKGGIPLNISGIANVKIAGESPALDNALQRLLGKPRPLVMRIAKETLEGYLRGVLATLTPEEVNANTQAFEKELRRQAAEGLDKLGLTLDNLKIQSISDDVKYLSAVGRIRSAELSRDNRVTEAVLRADSLVKQAMARQRGELSKIEAQLNISRAESVRRVANAQTAQQAFVAEQRGEVLALVTRAKAELALQDARIEQARHQLEAEVVTPARADMEARIAEARGAVAPIMEKGRAQAEALRSLADEWKMAGDAAKDLFVLQKLETILPTFLHSISGIQIDNITMLQTGGNGDLPTTAVATVKALEAGGINVTNLLNRLSGSTGDPRAKGKGGGLSAPRGTAKAQPPKAALSAPPARQSAPPGRGLFVPEDDLAQAKTGRLLKKRR